MGPGMSTQKIAPLSEYRHHLIHGSLGPPESIVNTANGISIVSAVLAELTVMSNRQTDHGTSATRGHIFAPRARDAA